jgi:hypothetical protein
MAEIKNIQNKTTLRGVDNITRSLFFLRYVTILTSTNKVSRNVISTPTIPPTIRLLSNRLVESFFMPQYVITPSVVISARYNKITEPKAIFMREIKIKRIHIPTIIRSVRLIYFSSILYISV